MQKGRNPNLILKRNQHLIKRYYYWYDIERKRRDDVLIILSEEEIFLDVDYITHLLNKNNHLLKELRQAKPSEKKLQDFSFSNIEAPAMVQADLFQVA